MRARHFVVGAVLGLLVGQCLSVSPAKAGPVDDLRQMLDEVRTIRKLIAGGACK